MRTLFLGFLLTGSTLVMAQGNYDDQPLIKDGTEQNLKTDKVLLKDGSEKKHVTPAPGAKSTPTPHETKGLPTDVD
jgi:hypothetical protein